MKIILALLISATCFGQGKQNVIQTGTVDAHSAVWIPPTATFASPPSSPPTGAVFTFTDAATVGSCTGGGSALATCRWSGSAYQAVGGGGGGGGTPGGSDGQAQINSSGAFAGQASIWSGGTLKQRAVECATGTISSTTIAALGAVGFGEITIQTGVAGTTRLEQILISETTRFTGTAWTALTASMGRTGPTTNAEFTGVAVPLMQSSGDANFWSARPIPPQLGATYTIVVNFNATGGLMNAATAGLLTWEVCGYAAR